MIKIDSEKANNRIHNLNANSHECCGGKKQGAETEYEKEGPPLDGAFGEGFLKAF